MSRIAKRLQYSLRVERGPLLDKIISSQDRCVPPTSTFNPNGFGCFMYFPLMWYDDQRVFEASETLRFQDVHLSVPKTILDNTFITLAMSAFLCIVGTIIYFVQWKKWLNFKSRIFLD